MADELPCLRARGREPEPEDHVVEPALEHLDDAVAGAVARRLRLAHVAAELPLAHAVDPLEHLLGAELERERRGPTPAASAVLAGRDRPAPVQAGLAGKTSQALQFKFDAFAA